MEPIITVAKENLGILAFAGVILIPLFIVYQKKAMPIIFHTAEYLVYLTAMHYVLYVMVVVAAWYQESTRMEAAGTGASTIYSTPRNVISENFFDKALYTPTWLFYFELVMIFVLLYVVVVVRPTSYSGANSYQGDKNRGMAQPEGNRVAGGKGRYDRSRAAGNRNKRG